MMNRGAPYLAAKASEHGCTAGEDGAKTEISIFRHLRGGSMLISAPCPVSARSAFQNTNDACETHRGDADPVEELSCD